MAEVQGCRVGSRGVFPTADMLRWVMNRQLLRMLVNAAFSPIIGAGCSEVELPRCGGLCMDAAWETASANVP